MHHNLPLRLLETHQDFAEAEPLVAIDGLSSPRVCHLLNQLVRHMDRDECYVEVGTWKGLTLLSAAWGNFGRTCIGCDRFRFYGRFTGLGVRARRALERNIRRHRGQTADIHFHHMSFQRMFAERRVSSPIGVYFYDGDHSYGGTYEGIIRAAPFLNERSVLLVDDWNDRTIRQATTDALERACLTPLWHRALPGDHDRQRFWNGLGVYHLEKGAGAARLKRHLDAVA